MDRGFYINGLPDYPLRRLKPDRFWYGQPPNCTTSPAAREYAKKCLQIDGQPQENTNDR